MIGALYLGFALMNWMTRDTRTGGIFNKPIVIGNFMHFFVGAITLIKLILGAEESSFLMILISIVYVIFWLSFAYTFRNNPKDVSEN